jgi:hypothetical protein
LYHELLRDLRVYVALDRCDRDLAEEGRAAPCERCGGPLDSDPFPRKPCGGPPGLSRTYWSRYSFTCRDCRKRRTTPSVRFFGRRWYVAPVFVLISAMRDGLSPRRLEELRAFMGTCPSVRTLGRWRKWWRDIFAPSAFWNAAKARFHRPVDASSAPATLLERFAGDAREKLAACLKLLSPVTTRPGSAMAV